MLAGCESRAFQPAFMPSGYAYHGGEYNVPPERNTQPDLEHLDAEHEVSKDYSSYINVPKGYSRSIEAAEAAQMPAMYTNKNINAFDATDGYAEYNK